MNGARRLAGIAVAVFTLVATSAGADPKVREIDPGAVDRLFKTWSKADSPGAALAVLHDGKIILERGYGSADLEHNVAITPQTAFYVGSVSKQFTAMCVALLAQRATIGLDDDVRKFVPELPDYGARITVRQLVHHTSGLRDYLGLRDLAGEAPDGVFGDAQILALICRQKALNFPPGTQYLYSNSGYFLLSVIVKRTTGKTLRTFAAENIFQPLAMTSAQFRDDHTMLIKNRAHGYAPRAGGYRLDNPNFDVVGAGGLFMTVRDFAAWDENFHAPKVGDRELIARLQTPGKLNDGTALTYGFGLTVGSFRGLRIVEHGGSYGGFRAHVIRFPDQHFSVVCLTNLATMVPARLVREVSALYLADALKQGAAAPAESDDANARRTQPAPATKKIGGVAPFAAAPRSRSAADFAGDYYSEELQATYRIRRTADGTLTLTRGDRESGAMRPLQEDRFASAGATLSFGRDGAGAVTSLVLDAGRVRGVAFTRK
jgi:CubicO group peptidase (beta-lactamase class C family)